MRDNQDYSIKVEVKTTYIPDQSDPDENRYVFAYTMTITNEGTIAATLHSRHWIITDANGKVQEVRGAGVVGEQPHLDPGEIYRYSSAAMIETPVGCMKGSYQMVADDGVAFEAQIPIFNLAIPHILH